MSETKVKTPIIESIMQRSKYSKDDESYSVVKQGVAEFISNIITTNNAEDKINKLALDEMIAHIDTLLSAQMDEILHNKSFQELESTWRGIRFLVERTNFNENVKIDLLDATKEEILDDFENNLDITQSTLYKQIYSAEYGQFGGEPVGAIVADYELDKSNQDMTFLNKMSSIAAMSHSPLLTSLSAKFFGLDNFGELENIKDLKSMLEGPQYTRWRTFRENEDAKYTGCMVNRFLTRSPYVPEDNPIKSFNYRETVNNHDDMLWGNGAYAFATRLTDSFADYRWCGNIIGPKGGGAVKDLPTYTYENYGSVQTKIPTEVLITDRREFELSENGFIALTLRRDSNNAAFFSANSALKPKIFPNTPEGKAAETNFRLGTQLPYVFLISRLAHYLKVLQREEIGTWKERSDVERGLNEWLRQYISDQENPPADVRSRRPFRSAKVIVSDIAGEPGWYKIELLARPHFKFMGANFELSLVGKLDKE
ncbi:type VI secretion system contractile sheath large subunit [Campylobacter concisus]|jgi:type VI secretion protein, evpB/VC_A0108 family|uniref:Type VI secretion system contractile sheath large subunit n=1 Tax=Campylobacter concisus TaxID=199 RepID=A0A0M4T9U4_9BACT|nr:type VI secretion system contractile sheath large subunit [Campylobacter concisus]MDO4874806.1 type VI secretion system contractile sheath large subunit [Campylobacter sp.]ALF46811.1 type VI secretion system, tubular sheath protein [Campylobacter concisus]MBE9819078.1 type VI secretion system contractile sheath large subunit [Campylobacter concisus]MBE9829206.1 type VI secretion system contractile sheath large subunit [Campylobacter concisus]ORI00483.1 type VI secretion protein [Campylobact